MLDEWAVQHSGWKKRLASLAWEDRNLKQATALHALCEAEAASITAYGLKNPVTVIPNGVLKPGAVKRNRMGAVKTLLFLGRLHEKKGLDRLIAAWNAVDPAGWQLKIVGSGDDHYINSLRALATNSRIDFAGPAYDEQRDAAYLAADAFILPSLSEGFPMAVLEAFSFELPVIMTRECNFPEAFAAGAAVETKYDITTLSASIEWLTRQSEQQLQAMGRQGARLASEQYNWALIAGRFENLYASIT
jgi:poly(glycerol-phosphate) alpha-glucosyltransferase